MGWWKKMVGRFGDGVAAAADIPDRLYVVDGSALMDPRGAQNGRPTAPRDMLRLLHRMAQFTRAEKVRCALVFQGEPLHKAPDGAEMGSLEVLYADAPDARRKLLIRCCKRGRGADGAVVFCHSGMAAELERAGAATMRLNTLRKALEQPGDDRGGGRSGGEPGGGDRNEPGDRNRRGRRGRGGRREGGGDRPSGAAAPPTPTAAEPADEPADSTPDLPDVTPPPPTRPPPAGRDVRELLDVVE